MMLCTTTCYTVCVFAEYSTALTIDTTMQFNTYTDKAISTVRKCIIHYYSYLYLFTCTCCSTCTCTCPSFKHQGLGTCTFVSLPFVWVLPDKALGGGGAGFPSLQLTLYIPVFNSFRINMRRRGGLAHCLCAHLDP